MKNPLIKQVTESLVLNELKRLWEEAESTSSAKSLAWGILADLDPDYVFRSGGNSDPLLTSITAKVRRILEKSRNAETRSRLALKNKQYRYVPDSELKEREEKKERREETQEQFSDIADRLGLTYRFVNESVTVPTEKLTELLKKLE